MIWTTEPDRHAKVRYVLRDPAFPKGSLSPLCADDRIAVCSYMGKRVWEASAWFGYHRVNASAGNAERAMRLLMASIGSALDIERK
jgi:hypothetical protein